MTAGHYSVAPIWDRVVGLVAELTKCVAEKMSATETARIISHMAKEPVSRNAVLGKANRMGLRFHSVKALKSVARPRGVQSSAVRARPIRQVAGSGGPSLPAIEPYDAQPAPDDLAIPVSQRRSLLGPPHNVYPERKVCECSWPVGDPKSLEFFYCGAATSSDSTYCAHHTRRSVAQPRQRQLYMRHIA